MIGPLKVLAKCLPNPPYVQPAKRYHRGTIQTSFRCLSYKELARYLLDSVVSFMTTLRLS